MLKLKLFWAIVWSLTASHAAADLTVDGGILTLFKDKTYSVEMSTDFSEFVMDEGDINLYMVKITTYVDGVMSFNDTMSLFELPDSVEGSVTASKSGYVTVSMTAELEGYEGAVIESSGDYASFGAGASLVPIILVMILAFMTGMAELSMFLGVFVGACMISGELIGGFKSTLDNYIVMAIANDGHAFVYLFTFFMTGLVGMMEKSGGMKGFSDLVSSLATTTVSGQFASYASGMIIFFDDYSTCLMAGASMRPVTDALGISREKLAFIVDSTASPIASLMPLSSWIGFEIGLIQDEIDGLIAEKGDADGISTSGFTVFLESIKYRYYSIFMLVFIPLLIFSKRDFGPMLIAERKVVIYDRKDGGDGAAKGSFDVSANAPAEDTPSGSWNVIVPVLILIGYVFGLLVKSGDDGSGEQSFRDKIESSDSYVALLYGCMATAITTHLFYMLQFKLGGKFVLPKPKSILALVGIPTDDETPVPLMSIRSSVNSFLFGMSKIFPALVILTLAWAISSVMSDLGTDRLFMAAIVESGLNPGLLPTLSFLLCILLAFCTGTSWGTMGIMFPLIFKPTYFASDGDPVIVYSSVAGILAGAIVGDHCSPISDTTILTALACECDVLKHTKTQIPYAGVVAIWSILVGTLPVGLHTDSYPNGVAIFLGIIFLTLTIFALGVPVESDTGRFDFVQELLMKVQVDEEMSTIKTDTMEKCPNKTKKFIFF